MAMSVRSSSWYRVAGLKPALRPHAKIRRHSFRGQRWYVIQDPASGRHHRFTPEAQLVISLMDGNRTVDEIWSIACERLGDDNLTQDDVIRLLSQLHQSDILQADTSPDLREMAARADRQARRKLLQSVMNPLAVRLPLLDPDRFLTATLPLVRPLFSWFGLLLFAAVVGLALVLAAMHWTELTANIADRVLATDSLLLLAVTYPFVKALHELGHGYATKVRGGEVHEVGLMFLVFIPVPYVDATAAASFPGKWYRALVGSAGMLVEAFLAALAMFVWVNVEPGLVKAFAFNVMVIGGVSTLLFNGNPLLRFDGYYVLSDLIEIPNLGSRANRYIGYLIQRYLFGVADATSPVTARGEAGWFMFYAIASFCYRIFITATIILFVASEYFIVGVILGIWSGLMVFVWPLAKSIGYLFTGPGLRDHRMRAFAVTGAFVAVVGAAVVLVPVPFGTVSEGVVWAEKEAIVNAGTDGIVEEVLVAPNAVVVRGQPLLRMSDPLLPARVRIVEAELRELQLRHDALLVFNRAEARVVAERIRHAEGELALNRERLAEMIVRSPADGIALLTNPEDMVGVFLRKGDPIGYVDNLADPVVRVVVPQNAIDLVRDRTSEIRIRFADRFDDVRSAAVVREIPIVTDRLPSAALTTQGGGPFAVDPSDTSGAKALEMLFQLDLRFVEPVAAAGIGSRVFVRFGHGREPLAFQIYRQVRQLFLRRFNV
jgi:putative peptide zinc metalloprotease protein